MTKFIDTITELAMIAIIGAIFYGAWVEFNGLDKLV